MYRPTPKFLLTEKLDIFNRTGIDSYNKATYAEKIEVKSVYIESIRGANNSSYGELSDCTLLMIFDFQNSTPKGTLFNQLDKVTYDGKDYIVRSVEIFKKNHIEVFLK